jgi:hypothetical protein
MLVSPNDSAAMADAVRAVSDLERRRICNAGRPSAPWISAWRVPGTLTGQSSRDKQLWKIQ